MLKHVPKVRTADLQDSLVHVDTLAIHLYREIARRLCQKGRKKSLETNAYNIKLIHIKYLSHSSTKIENEMHYQFYQLKCSSKISVYIFVTYVYVDNNYVCIIRSIISNFENARRCMKRIATRQRTETYGIIECSS